MYVEAIITSRRLSLPKFQFRIQVLPFEINQRKEKWLVMSIYRPPLDSLSQCLESLTGIIDFFSSAYENFIVMSDFNAQLLDSAMKDFIKVNGFNNINHRKNLL